MSIASKLALVKQDIDNARTAIVNKGGTITQGGGSSQLANDIDSIAVTSGIYREISPGGVYRIPQDRFKFQISSDATDIGEGALRYAFYQAPHLYEVDMSSIKQITGGEALYFAFYGCLDLETVDLSGLESINGSSAMYMAFQDCIGIERIDLSSLKEVISNFNTYVMYQTFMNNTSLQTLNLSSLETLGRVGNNWRATYRLFEECTSLTSVDLRKLQTIGFYGACRMFDSCTALTSVNLDGLEVIDRYGMSSAFDGCTSLETVNFKALNEIYVSALQNTFKDCSNLKTLYFPALGNDSFKGGNAQMTNMLNGVRGCTVHMRSDLNETIRNYAFIRNGFGGTNTTVLFDLPATE